MYYSRPIIIALKGSSTEDDIGSSGNFLNNKLGPFLESMLGHHFHITISEAPGSKSRIEKYSDGSDYSKLCSILNSI